LWAWCLLLWLCHRPWEVAAQGRVPGEPPDSTLPVTNPQATRRYQAAEELLLAQRWKDALDQIEPLLNQPGTGLVNVGQGRQVGVEQAGRMLLSGLSAEALERHRRRVDPLARRWWESGTEVDLRRIVDRAFHSSFGDDALLKLGDLAWERGEPSEARSYWERLVPPFTGSVRPPGVPPVPYYPDPHVEGAAVRARLVLSSAAAGDHARALRELAVLRREFPKLEQEGLDVAGNGWGALEELIQSGLRSTRTGIDSWSTLGGNAQRAQVAGPVALPTGIRWELELSPIEVDFQEPRVNRGFEDRFLFPPPLRGRANAKVAVQGTFPVIHQQGVFFCDDRRIWGLELAGTGRGQPLWGSSPVLFALDERQEPRGQRPRIGLPAHTLTIADDRLFARLGESAAASGPGGGGTFPSTLVSLDLQREGELTWQVTADQVGDEMGNWVFCGAPLADDGLLWVVLRKLVPQPVLNIACLDPATGKQLWNRRILQSTALFGGDFDEQQGLLLATADGRLFCGTNQGSVIALEARRGDILWVSSYDRDEAERVPDWHDRQTLGPNPCVCADGMVFFAPQDSASLLALDGASGVRLWQRPIPGLARQVVGVRDGRVLVAANQLFGLEVDTGEIAWSVGNESPDSRTRGRCALSANGLLWPRDSEILVVEPRSGRRLREIPLAEIQRAGGGNLAVADGFLVVAQTDRLLVFWEYLERRRRLEEDLTHTGPQGAALLALAMHDTAALRGANPRDLAIEQQAVDTWRRVLLNQRQMPQVWDGAGPGLLSRLQVPLFLEVGRTRRESGQLAEACELYRSVFEHAPRLQDRASAGLQTAELLMQQGNWDEAAEMWNRLTQDPQLVRLPREPGGTRSIGQTAVIELARIAQLRQSSLTPQKPTLRKSEATHFQDDPAATQVANSQAEIPIQPDRPRPPQSIRRETPGMTPGRLWTLSVQGGRKIACPSGEAWNAQTAWVLLMGERLECRDWATGALRWSSPVAERPTWVGGQEDSIVVATGSQLAVLDARTGETRWCRASGAEAPSGMARRLRCEGGTLLVLDPVHGVEAVDLRSGVVLWRFSPGGGSDRDGGVEAGARRDRTPRMAPFWWAHQGVVGVQTRPTRRVVFLDASDGFARESLVATAPAWREDPWPEPRVGWGLVCQPDLVQRLDPRSGTVATLDLPPPLSPSPGESRSARRVWSDGSGALVQPTAQELQWIPWESGGRSWKVTLRHRMEAGTFLLCRDERSLYFMDGDELCSLDGIHGGVLWRRPLDAHSPGMVRQIQRVGEWLLVALESEEGELRFELREPSEGAVDWVLRPRGKSRDWQVVESAEGLVVVTDSEMSVSNLSPVHRGVSLKASLPGTFWGGAGQPRRGRRGI
jgi:outer membrane protein assembly factor BamB